jgi:hypothetical protein
VLTKHPDAGLAYGGAMSIDAAGRVVGDAEQDATPERIDRPLYVWLSSHWGALPADLIDHGAASNLRDDRPLQS